MASSTFAVDLGSYSVKIAVATPSLRGAIVTHIFEQQIPPPAMHSDGTVGDDSQELRQRRAFAVLAQMVRTRGLGGDTAVLAVSGSNVFSHVLEFGFKSLRRSELERVVGAELEGVVPVDLEDMVYTFEALPAMKVSAASDTGVEGELVRGRVAAATTGLRVLAYAMQTDAAQALVAAATGAGATPRHLQPVGGAGVRLVERTPHLSAIASNHAVAVVDIGHETTDIVVVRAGRAVYSRSLSRGGRAVTDAIAKQWNMSRADAEHAKHTDGIVASSLEPAPSDGWARVHDAIIGEVLPMVRELKQSFAACRARTGEMPVEVLLVGGGSRLRGLASLVTEHTGLATATLSDSDRQSLTAKTEEGAELVDSAAMVMAHAFDGASGRPMFDLRQGDLERNVDLSFLRSKATPLSAALLLILAFAAGSAFSRLHKLRKAEKTLATRLANETTEHYGEVRSASAVLGEVSAEVAAASGAETPMPKLTAYDVLLELNRKLPTGEEVTLDVSEVAIDPARVVLKGTAKTLEEITTLEKDLKKVACFTDVSRGDSPADASGGRQFSFTITSACM